ncbi:signal peptidase II [Alphaproteobacteria bacterium]|jgi:signal peptidase II|nr:signal peptidase II [Alphaproteobacteria bacterium]
MRLLSLFFVTTVCALDQITKYFICSLQTHLPLKVSSFFSLILIKNRGISFGILDRSSFSVFFGISFLVITICIYLAYRIWHEKKGSSALALSFVLGGALGNLGDRLFRGGVIDFLDFHFGLYHWPAFNIADSFIFLGVLFLLWDNMKQKK